LSGEINLSKINIGREWDNIRIQVFQEKEPIQIRRPDDLLVFNLSFYNYKYEFSTSNTPLRLVKKDENAPLFLIVEFQPQSFGEESFKELHNAPSSTPSILARTRIRISGRSRLVFYMPPTESSLGYTLTDVLKAINTWPMQLDFNAIPESNLFTKLDNDNLELGIDQDKLKTIASSTGWINIHDSINALFRAEGINNIGQMIEISAQRIAEHALSELSNPDEALGELNQDLGSLIVQEANGLVAQFPELPIMREMIFLCIAAISLSAVEAIAFSQKKVSTNYEFQPYRGDSFPEIPLYAP